MKPLSFPMPVPGWRNPAAAGSISPHRCRMAAHAIKHAVERAGVDKEYVEDCYLGNCAPWRAEHRPPGGAARRHAEVDWPACRSTASARRACRPSRWPPTRIRSDGADCIVAGGVESISIPGGGSPKESIDPDLLKAAPDIFMAMIDTADIVAGALQAQPRIPGRVFAGIAAPHGRRPAGQQVQGRNRPDEDQDEGGRQGDEGREHRRLRRRPATSATGPTPRMEGLAKLEPVKGPGKYVTAGNASQLSDGAAAVVLMEAKDAEKRGLNPLGRFVAWAAAGCEPDEMGIGPIFAVPKLLKRHGLKVDDIDLWELNEAFASQCLYSRDQLGIDPGEVQRQRRLDRDRPSLRHDRRAAHRPHPAGRTPAQGQVGRRDHVHRRRPGRRGPVRNL